MQQLFDRWALQRPPSLHHSYGILYIDDILINIPEWASSDAMFSELRTVLDGLGLTVNMDKTHLMASASFLQVGHETLLEDSPLRELQWGTSVTYLRKKLSHEDHPHSLVAQAQRCMHVARDEMHPFLKRCSWMAVRHALHMLRQYIAAVWLWFAPLIFPLCKHVDKIDVWQTMYTVQCLHLYLPSYLSQDMAYSLLRVRRRAIRVTVLRDPKWRWVDSWVRRKWTYLGHLLRRGCTNVATSALLSCQQQQLIGAPWSSSVNWLFKVTSRVYDTFQKPTIAQLMTWAQDKEQWAARTDRVVALYQGTYAHVHQGSFPSVRQLFALSLDWLQPVFLDLSSWGWGLHVLHREEGWQYVTIHSIQPTMEQWCEALSHLRMLGVAWVLQLCLSELLQDVFVHVSALQQIMWQRQEVAVLLEILDDSQTSLLRKLSTPIVYTSQ